MSLKKIEQIKEGKWIRLWDIIAYAVLTVAVVILIITFTVGRDRSALAGFTVTCRGETLLTYDFTTSNMQVFAEENISVKEGEDIITITFTADDKKGYNKISVDVKKRTVSVVESNCSTHKDCVYTSALRNNSSTPIICTPHGLSISPLVFEDNGVI